jgi:hypothetical protein
MARRRAEKVEAVLWLHVERQMVPEAIADYLGLSDGQVKAYLHEATANDRLFDSQQDRGYAASNRNAPAAQPRPGAGHQEYA